MENLEPCNCPEKGVAASGCAWPCRREFAPGFTLLELLVAMAVLAILVVMLMGMVDSSTKLWRSNEKRVESYREARAALSIIARDLESAMAGTNTNLFRLNDSMLVPSGATNGTNADTIFLVTALPKSSQWSGGTNTKKSDLCQVGYFVGYGKTAAASNSSINTLNLYRFFNASEGTYSNLISTNTQKFPMTLSLLDSKVELLARNIVSFDVKAYSSVAVTNTTNGSVSTVLTNYSPSTEAALPNLVEVVIQTVNQEVAAKLTNAASWANTNSFPIKDNLQSFTTRIHLQNKP